MSTRFQKMVDGTRIRYVNIQDEYYKITIPEEEWCTKVTKHVNYWIKKRSEGRQCILKYGTVHKVLESPDLYKCIKCNKIYETRDSLYKHITRHHSKIDDCDKIHDEEDVTNIRSIDRSTNNTTNNSIHYSNNHITNNTINVPLVCNFSDENPKWLTQEVFLNAIKNLPSAIPNLIKAKHFNDDFPENQNIRIGDKRHLNKRIQIYTGDEWRIQDRESVTNVVIVKTFDILELLFDYFKDNAELTEGEEDVYEETDDSDSDEPDMKRGKEIYRSMSRSRFVRTQVARKLDDWKKLVDNMDISHDKTFERLNDKFDTFLLDHDLRMKTRKERRLCDNGDKQ